MNSKKRQLISLPRLGLSARLLLLLLLFIMVAEILFYIPTIAAFRKSWLEERLAAAQIAALALSAAPSHMVSDQLTRELLSNAGVKAVVLKRGDNRRLILSEDITLDAMAHFDLRSENYLSLMMDAAIALRPHKARLIEVTGAAKQGAGEYVQIILDETPLRDAMFAHTLNILLLSLVISFLAAGLVYLSLLWLLVRPIARMTADVIAFRDAPEDESRIIPPSLRSDEIGEVQRELSRLQEAVRAAFRQKSHLAGLGAGVAKINHDLRNILTSANLLSNRLSASEDPGVKTLAPRLIKAIDRAIKLCEDTLQYGRPENITPQRKNFKLRQTLQEVALSLGLTGAVLNDADAPHPAILWRNNIPTGIQVNADPDHVFRLALNLCRNACQSLQGGIPPSGRSEITVDAALDENWLLVDIGDSGPGLPEGARRHLFEPFRGSARPGGTGLGLAIAKELAEINGGDIELLKSDATGTVFRLSLPKATGVKKPRKPHDKTRQA